MVVSLSTLVAAVKPLRDAITNYKENPETCAKLSQALSDYLSLLEPTDDGLLADFMKSASFAAHKTKVEDMQQTIDGFRARRGTGIGQAQAAVQCSAEKAALEEFADRLDKLYGQFTAGAAKETMLDVKALSDKVATKEDVARINHGLKLLDDHLQQGMQDVAGMKKIVALNGAKFEAGKGKVLQLGVDILQVAGAMADQYDSILAAVDNTGAPGPALFPAVMPPATHPKPTSLGRNFVLKKPGSMTDGLADAAARRRSSSRMRAGPSARSRGSRWCKQPLLPNGWIAVRRAALATH